MKHGKLNLVLDAQHGSAGKGLIASFLAKKYKVENSSTNNLPNAGHTAVLDDGTKFISKILPVSMFLNTVGQDVKCYIGPGAGFSLDRLFAEIKECEVPLDDVRIHPRAMVVTGKHAAIERGENDEQGTKHIASTMQGSGAVQSEKMMRGPDVKLARDYPELQSMIVEDWIEEVHSNLESSMWLHEGSQGFSLGINHGSHYPQCTSRECTSSRELMDMGLPPSSVGDVYMVLRPYPIRVGSVIEDGVEVGYSGDMYPDQVEMTWEDVKKSAGYPEDYDLHEMTTVTKRLRRVFTFSMEQVKKACKVNGATKLALNFANYLDYSCFQTSGHNLYDLPDRVVAFILELEKETGLPVVLVGTGPGVNHVWDLE